MCNISLQRYEIYSKLQTEEATMKWEKMEFWEKCEVFCEVFFLEHDIIGRIFAATNSIINLKSQKKEQLYKLFS